MSSFRTDVLAGRHIVISGGCGSLGAAVVKTLAEHGAALTVNDILEEGAALDRLDGAQVNVAASATFAPT